MEKSNPETFFPEAIVYLVLLRVPVRYLLRFRSVCKLWLSIICAPDFIKTHHSMSTKDPHLVLVDAPFQENRELSTCSLCDLQNDLLTEIIFDESTIEDDINSVVGCCNGLVCLLSNYKSQVVFWNPSTRKSRRLPKFDMGPDYDDGWYGWHGFCYDECNDDFKVFVIYGDPFEFKVSVYSSKSDSWRLVNINGDLPFGDVFGDGVFTNRAIYLRVATADDDIIICFDIKTGMYRQVLQPKYQQLEEIPYWALGKFDDSLYVLYNLDTNVDIWVMNKDCGPEESWTKLVTIERYDRLVTFSGHLRPICNFGDGLILLNLYHTLVLYNSKDNEFEDLFNFKYERLYVYSYVESLISP